jgi:DNA-binding transcriptional MerR regulator
MEAGVAAKYLRIGEVAKQTGVSAKALRLYQQRGLLKPSAHSPSGYRLYGAEALARLMQIVLLRRSGFALSEIGTLLANDTRAAGTLLGRRIAALERELGHKHRTLAELRLVAQRASSGSTLPITQLLESIRMSTQLKVELSAAERAELQQRAEQLGGMGMGLAEREWPELIASVRRAMDAKTPATDPGVIELAKRWHALVRAFSGGNAGIERKVGQAYVAQPEAMAAQGMDFEMFRYVGEAMRAAGLELPGRAGS